ncbi:unnamed protein product [Lathyrus oleraceus]
MLMIWCHLKLMWLLSYGLGPSQTVEADEPLSPQAFGRGHVELSLMPLYLDHTVKHIWDGEGRDPLKFINHGRKITGLSQSNDEWFQAILSLSGMKDLCKIDYVIVNHKMLSASVER